MEDRETTSIAMDDKVIACNYFQLCQGNLHIKKYGTQASKTNWIASDIAPTLTIDILPASQWNTRQEIEQRTMFVSWNVVLFFVEYFDTALASSCTSLRDCVLAISLSPICWLPFARWYIY